MQTVVAGEQLTRAFAIAAWRETEPGYAFDQIFDVMLARRDPEECMAEDVFIDLFGRDMLRHVKTTEIASC